MKDITFTFPHSKLADRFCDVVQQAFPNLLIEHNITEVVIRCDFIQEVHLVVVRDSMIVGWNTYAETLFGEVH